MISHDDDESISVVGIDDQNSQVRKRNAKSLDAMTEADAFLRQNNIADGGGAYGLRYYHETFYEFCGTCYRERTFDDLRAVLVPYLDRKFTRLTTAATNNVLLCLKALTHVDSSQVFPGWIDQRPGIWLPLENGLLNVSAWLAGESKVLIPHTPGYFSANCLPYPFTEEATCPKWGAFLQRNLEGDAERISVLQEFFGYCLTPSLSSQKFLFHEGQGANGKSVSCAVLTAMLGEENVSAVPLEMFGDRFGLYSTQGKFANIAAEVGELDRVAEGVLKAFTSGDAIQFDRKHRDPISARPTAKLVFASNNRPKFTDKSGGLWRRMILMPWRITVPESERVRGMDEPRWWVESGELPGILIWALKGLGRLEQQNGFTASTVCDTALAEYRAESNPTRMFLEEHFKADPSAWVGCDDLYRKYTEWMHSNGFSPMSASALGHEIRRVFDRVERRQKMVEGSRFMTYSGMTKA